MHTVSPIPKFSSLVSDLSYVKFRSLELVKHCREQSIQFQLLFRLMLEHFLRNLKFPIAMNGLKLNQDQEPLL
jgi:hypothetical protein